MADITDLEQYRKRRQERRMPVPVSPPISDGESWMQGRAVCMECKCTWVAIAPVGTYGLECPHCNTHKGVFEGLALPEYQAESLTCGCDNSLFLFLRNGNLFCIYCGAEHLPEVD